MARPLLLDLFCGAGGASAGYVAAGFDVVGVDVEPQPRYPFAFVQADALTFPLDGFDAVHASPPCQAYAGLAALDGRHPRLIEPTRARLCELLDVPWVIENIPTAPLRAPFRLCGSSFGLFVRRHRHFEPGGWQPTLLPPCAHHRIRNDRRAYYGKPGWLAWEPRGARVQSAARQPADRPPLLRGTVDTAARDMGIDWMDWDGLREAIPPAFTEWIGAQLLDALALTA